MTKMSLGAFWHNTVDITIMEHVYTSKERPKKTNRRYVQTKAPHPEKPQKFT